MTPVQWRAVRVLPLSDIAYIKGDMRWLRTLFSDMPTAHMFLTRHYIDKEPHWLSKEGQ